MERNGRMKKPGLVGPIIMIVIGVIIFPLGLVLIIPGIIILAHRLSARKLRSGGAPSADPQKQITCKIAGVRHKCRKNNTKPRQEVLQNMRAGDKVLVEEYEYEGMPAYMLIDPATNWTLVWPRRILPSSWLSMRPQSWRPGSPA